MKKIIIVTLCLLMAAVTLSAQKTLYVIDNETVGHFDGSQLRGKIIKDYRISTTGKGNSAITVHSITTYYPKAVQIQADSISFVNGGKYFMPSPRAVVYVIDGVKQDASFSFKSLSSKDIDSITVLKDGSPEHLKYGDANTSVILIKTKRIR